jgi:hypothetical protein
MARGPSAKVVLNRQALNELGLALAEGMEDVAKTIVETANPPDATPYGVGLVRAGGWAAYFGSKKVGGGGLDGKQPGKPRAFRPEPEVVSAIAGFGFPARFVEYGTVKMAAEPFLWPAVLRVKDEVPAIMKRAVGKWGRP